MRNNAQALMWKYLVSYLIVMEKQAESKDPEMAETFKLIKNISALVYQAVDKGVLIDQGMLLILSIVPSMMLSKAALKRLDDLVEAVRPIMMDSLIMDTLDFCVKKGGDKDAS